VRAKREAAEKDEEPKAAISIPFDRLPTDVIIKGKPIKPSPEPEAKPEPEPPADDNAHFKSIEGNAVATAMAQVMNNLDENKRVVVDCMPNGNSIRFSQDWDGGPDIVIRNVHHLPQRAKFRSSQNRGPSDTMRMMQDTGNYCGMDQTVDLRVAASYCD